MAEYTKSAEGHVLTFNLDGTVRTVNIDEFSEQTRDRGMVHGFLQVLGDSYAGAKAKAERLGKPEGETAVALFDARLAGLREGWSARSIGSIPREPAILDEYLVAAIVKARKKDPEKAAKFVASLREAKRHHDVKKWKDQPDILPIYNDMLKKAGKAPERLDDAAMD